LDISVENELDNYLKETVKNHTQNQIESQNLLFTNWEHEQSSELKQQIKNFQIDVKKAEILKRIGILDIV
jgi:predicted flavoprotein YhiN